MAVQGFRTVAVHVPVFKNGAYDGTIAFLLSFDRIADKYVENIRVGTSGYAWVVSEKGVEISSRFPDHLGKIVYDTYKDFPEIISMIDEMLKGKEGATVYHYYRFREGSDGRVLKHAVYMPMTFGNTFWSIVIATPEDEVLASLSGFKTKLFLLTITLLVVCVICMYLIVRFRVIAGEQQQREVIQTALRESEARYRYLFEQNPVPMLIYELGSLAMLAVNDAFTAHYGYSKTEALALRLTDLYPESERQDISDLIRKLVGIAYVGEWHHLKKDGTQITIEAHSHGFSYDGRAARIAVVNDITERKQAEISLRESERRYHTLARISPVGIFRTNRDGATTYVNPKWSVISGLSAEKALGNGWLDAVHPDDKEKLDRGWQESTRLKRASFSDYRFVRPDGTIAWVLGQAVPEMNAGGQIVGYVGTITDITERKRAETALRESEERYRNLLEVAPVGIAVYSGEKVVFTNPAGARLLGAESEVHIVGKSIADIIHPDGLTAAQTRIQKMVAGEQGLYPAENTYVRLDGSSIDVEVMASALSYEGKPAVQVIVTDITERKRTEEDLRSSRERLRSLTARLQQVREEERTVISREIHDELGQSLTGLKMDVSWLQQKLREDQHPLRELCGSMRTLIDTTIRTVQRISSELRPGMLDELGLTAAIEWQAQEFERRTGVHCILRQSDDSLQISREGATALFRIFQETLTNVIRHAAATGVHVTVHQDETHVMMEVHDNGKGISNVEIGSSRAIGLLGMSERARALDGSFAIRGEPAGGTTVTVRIPKGEMVQ